MKYAIDEAFLGQVEALQMLIRNNVAGQFGGSHKAKTFGSSCEFADYRDYLPGDDIAKIDWNAYARFEKLYLKLYLDERQMHTRIYIDASRSMDYGRGGKAEQALKLAAVFAYLSVCDSDRVSIYVIRGGRAEEIVTRMGGRESFFEEIGKLNEIEFDGESRISDAILSSVVGYGDGMSVIISDFLTENNFEDAIDYLAGKKRDILCVQVLSKEELHPLIRGKQHLYDSEDAKKFYRKRIDREIIAAYKAALEYTVNRIRQYCAARGAEYLLVSAAEDAGEILFDKLVSQGVLK